MGVTIILVISVLLQFTAAFLALRLIWITGRRTAWVLIAAALLLMAVRRCITLFQAGFAGVPEVTSMSAELVALVISILMLSGVIWIAPLFVSLKRSEEGLREARDELEMRVQERTENLTEANQKLEREIAEHKKAREQIAHLASFPELNPNPILEMDMAGNIKYMNPASQVLFPDLSSQGSRHPFLADWELINRHLNRNEPPALSRDVRIGESWYEQSYVLIPSSGDIRIYTRDITKRKRTEEVLREREQDLNRAQAVAKIGSWRLDVQRNQLLWSDETHRIFGIPRETPMTYETFLSSVHPEERECVDRQWQAALGGEPYDIEHRIIVGDEVKWVRERAELEFDENGALKGGFGTVQDITERKRLEDELRVKDFAVSSATLGIAITDLDGYVTYLNLACLSMWNYEEEEVLGKHATFFFAGENEAGAGLKAVLEEGFWQGELKAKRGDGSTFDVQILANLVSDADGEPFCSMASFVDITERKRAEEALLLRQAEIQTLFDNIPAGVVLFDASPPYTVLVHNRCYQELFAEPFKSQGMTGLNVYQYAPEVEAAGVVAVFDEVVRTKQPKSFLDFPYKSNPPNEYWFNWYMAPIIVKDQVVALVSMSINVTEHHIAERSLKESEARFRALSEMSPTGVGVSSVDGVLLYANPSYEYILGYERGELTGIKASDLYLNPVERSSWLGVMKDNGVIQDFKTRLKKKDGTPVWVSISASPAFYGGEQAVVGTIQDITERKKVERLKDEFIGMVSHELRTPLTVINGCLSTVLTEWERLPSGETQQLLRDAVLEGEVLSHLIENLLELSRFQAQQLTLYAETIDVKKLITDSINKIKRQAQSHRFVTSIPDKLMLMHADPLRIERILYNLLENAVKYSPPESQVKVSAIQEPERLVIGVHDQGRGLSISEQAKLFTPFWRLEDARPDRARGAGLGLVVCQVLVEAHGGEIWVESKIGKGSTFFFSLPNKKVASE